MRTVKEVSKLTGISVRTLHYYDQIGLLVPTAVTEAGYRLYDDNALEKLQQIMLYRELEFPLKDIKNIMESSDFDRNRALEQQIELLPNDDGTEYSFTHPALANIKIYPGYIGEKFGMCIKAAGEWNFVCDEKGQNYQYITGFGKESDMIMADSFGFENYQRAFSGRGYIWSRTLPLLKEHIFLGSGPDTFVLEFPQEDYLKMKQNGYQSAVMTKPHSLYLQVGVQTGVLSLLCMLVFFCWYVVWGLKLYAFRKLSTQTEAFGIAAFIGSLGYMITGISNDSMVATAPVFWGMVAIGLAANAMVTKQRKQELSATEKK